MSPIRNYLDPYDGPERRRYDDPNYHGPERRHHRTHRVAILATFWAIIGIMVIISGASLYVAYRSSEANCVLVRFLDDSIARAEVRAKDPHLPATERERARQALEDTKHLAHDLRGTGVFCG